MLSTKIIPAPASSKIEKKYSDIAVYWGTFDPVTEAHFDIIKHSLQLNFRKIIIAVNDNKSTGKIYQSPIEERMKMIRIMRDDLLEKEKMRIAILPQRVKELEYKNIKEMFPGETVTAIVGQDSFEKSVADCKWCDKVLVVPRGKNSKDLKRKINELELKNTIKVDIQREFLETSSSAIRLAIKGEAKTVSSMHPKVMNFINQQRFYKGEFTAEEHRKLRIVKHWLQKREIPPSVSFHRPKPSGADPILDVSSRGPKLLR